MSSMADEDPDFISFKKVHNFFIIKFNGAMLRPADPRWMSNDTSVPKQDHITYFDYILLAASVYLKTIL